MPTEFHRLSVAPFPAIAGAKRRESPPSSARALAASYAATPSFGHSLSLTNSFFISTDTAHCE
jgi:hypothetical protein